MALTLTFMRELVRNRLDDEDFENEYLDQALNEAQWDILRNRNLTFLEKSSPVTLLTGENTVAYPTDMKSLIGVRAIATGIQSYNITENYVDYADFQTSEQPVAGVSTAPLWWTEFAGSMVFPGLADKDYTITVDYIKTVPRAVADDDEFAIPDEFQELLKIGAYMRIAKREDDYDVKQQEQLDYQRLLDDLVKTYTRNRGPRRKHVMRVMGR